VNVWPAKDDRYPRCDHVMERRSAYRVIQQPAIANALKHIIKNYTTRCRDMFCELLKNEIECKQVVF